MLASHYYEGKIEAGCDEAGRGCLAGSVYAAAVKFFIKVLAGHVGTVFGIAATLVFFGTQFFDDLFVMLQILGLKRRFVNCFYGEKGQ